MSAIRPLELLSSGPVTRVASSVARVPPWVFAGVALAGILPVAVLGQIHRDDRESQWYLDNEDTFPAAYSGALLMAAAVLAILVASELSRGRFRSFWIGMGAVFAFMALDEVWTIHESLEGWTGADWQLFYLPIAVGAGVLVVVAFRDLAAYRSAAALFVAGGTAWLAAQVLEDLQWAGDVLEHQGMIVPEEVLELIGSTLFGLSALVVLRRVVARRGGADSRDYHTPVGRGKAAPHSQRRQASV
jgi:hypothetical protein